MLRIRCLPANEPSSSSPLRSSTMRLAQVHAWQHSEDSSARPSTFCPRPCAVRIAVKGAGDSNNPWLPRPKIRATGPRLFLLWQRALQDPREGSRHEARRARRARRASSTWTAWSTWRDSTSQCPSYLILLHVHGSEACVGPRHPSLFAHVTMRAER